MRERGIGDVLLFGGGIIPEGDSTALKKMGVGELFTPGTSMQTIVALHPGTRRRLTDDTPGHLSNAGTVT